MSQGKYKDILDTFTESFPLLDRLYDVYDKTDAISNDQEATLRKSVEENTLEVLELVVIASRQSVAQKKETLRQANTKLDMIKVFVDLGMQTGKIKAAEAQALSESINGVGKMIGGWIKRLNNPATTNA